MASLPRRPCALTVAGSDSGGGAGIQADLATFGALGVHGVTAITCLTAQNPRGVSAVQAAKPEMVRQQLEAVAADFRPTGAKTGMLFSAALVRVVAEFFEEWGRSRPPLVVDPVMVATSGSRLLQSPATRLLERRLLPQAHLVTPNLDEIRVLAGVAVRDLDDLREAARTVHARFGCAVLAKGGHLPGARAVDVFWDGTREVLLEARRVPGRSSHGTGCTFSAATAAYLARGERLSAAVQKAKGYVTRSLQSACGVGRHKVLGHAPVFLG